LRKKEEKELKKSNFKTKRKTYWQLEKPQSIFNNSKSSNLSSDEPSSRYIDYKITVKRDIYEEGNLSLK